MGTFKNLTPSDMVTRFPSHTPQSPQNLAVGAAACSVDEPLYFLHSGSPTSVKLQVLPQDLRQLSGPCPSGSPATASPPPVPLLCLYPQPGARDTQPLQSLGTPATYTSPWTPPRPQLHHGTSPLPLRLPSLGLSALAGVTCTSFPSHPMRCNLEIHGQKMSSAMFLAEQK